jgi:hypothetical protein
LFGDIDQFVQVVLGIDLRSKDFSIRRMPGTGLFNDVIFLIGSPKVFGMKDCERILAIHLGSGILYTCMLEVKQLGKKKKKLMV